MPYLSERDIEIPRLFDFLDRHPGAIETALDVGCFGSQYLEELSKKIVIVDGIDIKPGEAEKKFLVHYFVGDFVIFPLMSYDLVISISTLEHVGIDLVKGAEFSNKRYSFFQKLVDTTRHFLFVTFPYGFPAIHEGQFAVVTKEQLKKFLEILGTEKYQLKFYFNEKPQSGAGWNEISKEQADEVRYNPAIGVQCVCILEAEK
jgi:hypothetical protein